MVQCHWCWFNLRLLLRATWHFRVLNAVHVLPLAWFWSWPFPRHFENLLLFVLYRLFTAETFFSVTSNSSVYFTSYDRITNRPLDLVHFLNSMFINCIHVKRCSFTFLHVILFLQNCSNFAVAYDWNGKISENIQNMGLLRKIEWFFWRKILNFFNITK